MWMPYRLFPYERRLGLRELECLGLTVLDADDDAVTVVGDVESAARRGTYFDHFVPEGAEPIVTQQSVVEAAHLDGRTTTAVRQATRYGLHGIHEYKGKFNPQVVRSLCNVVDPTAELLIDPFCGSGTGLLEGLRLGMDVIGIDRSPMAWYLTDAKVEAAAHANKTRLAEDLLGLCERVAMSLDEGQSTGTAADIEPALGSATAAYLRDWFPAAAFAGLSNALALLHAEPESTANKLALVALSSILRTVSLQLPEDLRIRRRPEPFVAPPLAPMFMEAATSMRQGLTEMTDWEPIGASASVIRGSTDDSRVFASAAGDRRRLVLTSPPYATALPYIDTDRLSVLALGLASASDLMPLERELLGSREWVRAQQTEWDQRREQNIDRLPDTITAVLEHIDRRNSEGKAGFRKKALPSLLYRYFAGMADAMSVWAHVLAPGERAVLIVGHNHTTAAGERIDIATPELLGDAAGSRGFEVIELIRLEAWPRYGLHSANGVPGEDALVIERTG
jgi:hypothetical protein